MSDKNPVPPVPLPRLTLARKPVPLPRSLNNDNDEPKPSTSPLSTNSLKKGLKRVTSNVQETTRNVSNSVKNILKRQSTSGTDVLKGDDKENECYLKTQSLPADDVLCAIEFGSPIVSESFPPSYPPPPLPDESLYDSLVSKSSTDSHYEEVSFINKFREASVSEDSQGATYLPKFSRSNSWNFYDPPHGINHVRVLGNCYENVAVEDSYVELTENIYSDEPCNNADKVDGQCLTPKIPSRSSDSSSPCSSKCLTNECYENWAPAHVFPPDDEFDKLSSKTPTARSVIYEFDPLFEIRKKAKEAAARAAAAVEEEDEDNEVLDLSQIPTPPERVDSLPEAENPVSQEVEYFLYHRIAGNSSFYVSDNSTAELVPVEKKEVKKVTNLVRWNTFKRAMKIVKEGSNWTPNLARKLSKAKDTIANRIAFAQSPHQGMILKSPSNGEKPKEWVTRWCQLAEGNLTLAVEKNSSNKEIIPLENILSIQNVMDPKSKTSDEADENVHCWEVSVSGRAKPYVLGTTSSADSKLWRRKLLESLTNVFPLKLSAEYSRAGQCFIKEGVTGTWRGAWIVLAKQILYYCQMEEKAKEIDLRKARHIAMQSTENSCETVTEPGPYIQVHSVDTVIYLQMDTQRETKAWKKTIKTAANESGPTLSEQQLTKDDIPVVVDKCINFIYAHGSMSEGIYRRSGANANVNKLMSLMRADAWSVQLSRKDYTEFDVSTVLKRFFRELSDPLLTSLLHKYLCNASNLKCSKYEKVSTYRSIFEKLPAINYNTTRKLIGHLHFISELADRNKMPVSNLAAIWAPTLMSLESKGLEWSKKECKVINDIITNYKAIFLVDCEENDREKRMLEALEKVQTSPNIISSKPSGDIKIAFYLGSRRSESVSLVVNPNMEAGEICSILSHNTKYAHNELCIMEMVLGGTLSRPLHHKEKVLNTALKWSYWDDADRKDNYFVICPNTIYREIYPLAKPPLSKSGQLKYADTKSKSFKTYNFEFSQAKLSYYKDKSCSNKITEWPIEEITWYIGHEPKRSPQTRWAITFIEKDTPVKRTKDSPYFGYTIAGTSKEDQLLWMAAMLLGQYQHSDLLPRPVLI